MVKSKMADLRRFRNSHCNVLRRWNNLSYPLFINRVVSYEHALLRCLVFGADPQRLDLMMALDSLGALNELQKLQQ